MDVFPQQPVIPSWMAGCSCVLFATLFVGSLYLFPAKASDYLKALRSNPQQNEKSSSEMRLDRDNPLVIKQRIKGILFTSLMVTIYLWLVFSFYGIIPSDQ
ncbi:hypothetical protein FBU30_010299, partial [Linnemannia zychae]